MQIDDNHQQQESLDIRPRPLVTFALFAYNQEAYVREGVRAALAQDYRPLQIILSDDASTDRTFELMQDEAKDCPGDVRLVLNRNEQNLGIGRHINKVVAMSSGEFLVLASGDDVSLPDRASVSVEALLADDRQRRVLHGTVTHIDASGNVLNERRNSFRAFLDSPEAVLANDACLTGSSVTVRRSMYTDFPELNPDVINEDKITAFRCSFFGGAIYMDKTLTLYRVGVGVATLKGDLLLDRDDPEREARYIRTNLIRRVSVFRQMQVDAESEALAGRITPALRIKIDGLASSAVMVLKFVNNPKISGLHMLLAVGGFSRKTAKIAILFLTPGLFRRYKLLRKSRSMKV